MLTALLLTSASAQASSIKSIAINDFVYVLKANGSVVGWGNEEYPMALRDGEYGRSTSTPTPIAFTQKFEKIFVSYKAGYGVDAAGALYAWGANDYWQLGNNPDGPEPPRGVIGKSSTVPVKVPGIAKVVSVTPTSDFALALDSDGGVFVWGDMHDGTEKRNFAAPIRVQGLPPIQQIAAARNHCLALDRSGNVWAWGNKNSWGELGHMRTEDRWRPTKVAGLTDVVSIAAGGSSINLSAAVRRDGSVWVWGSNQGGLLGNGTYATLGQPGGANPKPARVNGITTAKSVALGDGHIAVLLSDGTLRMWGHDGWGQIGVGTAGGYHYSPKQPKITNVARIYIGGSRNLAVKTDGTLWFWGPAFNRCKGLLGVNQKVPVKITIP